MVCYTRSESDILAEIERETLETHPVHMKCSYARFVSRSKGRNRKRRIPLEVELVGYRNRSYLEHNFPYDTVSTEVYGFGGLDADTKLRREIPIYARR